MQLDNRVMPWKSGSSSLVSLLDMIKFCAEEFWDFVWGLEALFKDGIFASSRPAFIPDDIKLIKIIIEQASHLCKLAELDAVSEVINHIESNVKNLLSWFPEAIPPVELGAQFGMLRYIIERELSKRLFMYIPLEQAQWYGKKDGFGQPVSEAFPSAIEDIKEAGNCYATDRYTACVFHLMRVLEHGLRVLATEVCLDFDQQQWHTIINQIISVINKGSEKLKAGSPKAKRLKFLSEAALDFRFFKDAWRNFVSHGRDNYEKQEAVIVLNHVKSFMVHLSTLLSE